MKTLTTFFITAFSIMTVGQPVRAETLDEYRSKITKVVKKDGRCQFAVATMPRPKWDGKLIAPRPSIVLCIGDITVAKNAMNEKHGCAAFVLDIYNLNTSPLYAKVNRHPQMIEGKSCNESVFNELLKKEVNPYHHYTVEQVFSFVSPGTSSSEQYQEMTVIYPENESSFYHKWFQSTRDEISRIVSDEEAKTAEHEKQQNEEVQRNIAEQKKENQRQQEKKRKADDLWK